MADFLPHLRLRTLIDPSMEVLPVELTIDILSRLSVKTIIQCKLVCKKWRNLVSDSSFVNLHLSRSPTGFIIHHTIRPYIVPNEPGILEGVEIEDKVDHHHLCHRLLFSVNLNLVPILQNTRMHPVGSVNGLICLWQYSLKLNLDCTYICNPVTREYMILPRQRLRFKTYGFVAIACGFGVSSRTGEYKVVQTFQRKPATSQRRIVLEAEVYTLSIDQWRSLSPVHVTYWLNTFQELYGVFLNNHSHWIVRDIEDTHEKIATFDFDKKTFQFFPAPPVKADHFYWQSLAILNGCVCKLDTYDFELTIWVMKEYRINNSWHKQVVITPRISILKWLLYRCVHLIKGLKDGSILMIFRNKLCVFDPRSQTIEDTKMVFDPDLSGWAYRPSFLKLQNFESERVHMF